MKSTSVALVSNCKSDIDVGKASSKLIDMLGFDAEFKTVNVASLVAPSPKDLPVL